MPAKRHLNKFNVIYLGITLFTVREEIEEAFPNVPKGTDLAETLVYTAKTTGEKFIMIIDEWCALFREAKNDAAVQ